MLNEFVLGVGVVTGLNAFLALLLVLAERTLSHYGPCTLTINDEKKLVVPGGQDLLSTLKREGLFIPSACGGRGSCGLCKVTVLDGGDPLATEIPWLKPEEIARHVRLACQVRIKHDLRLHLPREWFAIRQFQATVVSIRDLTHDIKELRLRLVDPPEIEFQAGQFIQLEVPPYELTDEPVYRAYSISSPPSNRREIELEIRYVPNGLCTTWVHRHLNVGDPVTFNGPYGQFVLRPGNRPIIAIAGGSGMAPLKAIFLDMAEKGIARSARYFFGARSRRDLFLVEEMKALETRIPGFQFIPALSNPLPEDRWEGETGLITEVAARHVPDASGAEAYLCGSSFLIKAAIAMLTERGMPRERIYFDDFG
jgi:Na+-transporting NADH:ubiquinone oxidoreductase subunit F